MGMGDSSEHKITSHAGDGLSGFQRYWPQDEDASGYGVAMHMGTDLITCRLFDLEASEPLYTERLAGDFGSLSAHDLNAIVNDLFVVLAEGSGVKLSKLTSAVVSGPTAMVCKAAGVDLPHIDDETGLLGDDIEYLIAGPTSIAVGEAYYVPCISAKVGADFLCSLLAIDILEVEEPIVFVNTGTGTETSSVVAYGSKDGLVISALDEGMDEEQGIRALLKACESNVDAVKNLLVMGSIEAKVPAELEPRTHKVGDAAIEGTSAILLSESAEDQLSRMTEVCKIVKL